ncbi:hypothetical protein ACFYYN_18205 [Streptomyces sp. NPDC001902]
MGAVVVFASMFIGGAVLAADYRDSVHRFLDFWGTLLHGRPNDVLPRGFARAFGAFWAFMGATGIVALTVNAVTGH